LVVLGSGGPRPFGRAGSSYIVEVNGQPRILIDAGPGAFVRIGELNIGLGQVDTVLLTHLHIDHTGDLPGFFKARTLTTREPAIRFTVFGPEGGGLFPSTSRLLNLLFDKGGAWEYQRTFGADEDIRGVDLSADLKSPKRQIVDLNGLRITAIATHHDDCPSIAYRVDYNNQSIVFSGDMDASAVPNLVELAKGCSLLVFHCAVLDPPNSPSQLYSFHTPPRRVNYLIMRNSVATLAILATLTLPVARAEDPKSDFFTTSDGVKIHYLALGDRGSWVVLIHGFTDSAQRMFFTTGIAQELAKTHRVVALDNRNHGQSDKPQPNGPGRAEDTIELMDHLKIDKAHIHGYSMGGGITGQLLASHPERFLTAAFGGSGIAEADDDLRKKAVAMDTPMPTPQGAEAAAFQRLRDIASKGRPANAPAAPRPTLQIDLAKVAIPVLAINGEFDSPHAKTRRMSRELKNFSNVILPGRNHMSAIAVGGPMPQQYIDTLVDFINANDAAMKVPASGSNR